jgi:hypothetical protein
MPAAPKFIATQYAFSGYLRDPARNPPPPDVPERRIKLYRELFFNSINSLLVGTFPVLRRVLSELGWQALVSDYYACHQARTPLFSEVPREFLRYLETERGNPPGDPAFLYELAHYEWVELAVGIDSREIDGQAVDAQGDLLDGCPVLSPVAWPLAYRFPVHRISPDYQPAEPPPQPTYLVVYRNRADDVGFLELNPVSARLLQKISEHPTASGRRLLQEIAAELKHPNPDVVLQGGLQILENLRTRDVVLGSRKGV